MLDALIVWSHALAAFVFASIALWAIRRTPPGLPRAAFVAALALVAVWGLAVAGLGGADPGTRLAQGLRDLALLVLMALALRGGGERPRGVAPIYGVVALVVVASSVLQIAGVSTRGIAARHLTEAAVLLRMMAEVAALMLVHNLASTVRASAPRALAAALAVLWSADLALATAAYLTGTWPGGLMLLRGVAAAASGAVLWVGLHQPPSARVAVSRTVAWRSLSLAAVGGYIALLAIVTSVLSAIGGEAARLWLTAFVFGSAAAAVTLLSSDWLRAWLRVTIAKHLYSHRYDYRAEWLRFTGTLAAGEGPLATRCVRAVADLTESPAGLLLVRDGDGLGPHAGWHWEAGEGAGAALATHLATSHRIVELDPLRRGAGNADELAAVPQWMLDDPRGWALVPLIHGEALVGAILLARPALDRALDWEDFDLLKVAGRGVASYLAEARAQDALGEAARFDEFNRRFAFIVHDIKNLASGIALVARNAERHADNPAFRADMIATLNDSAGRINALLARLSASGRRIAEPATRVMLLDVAERVAARHRIHHPVVAIGEPHAAAHVEAGALEQLLDHLVQNAREASGPAEPVTLRVRDEPGRAIVEVIDRGAGMSPGFVRDQLFRPFASSKPTGFGLGAFEARQLAEAMGGTIAVESREGEGSVFRVEMPASDAWEVAA